MFENVKRCILLETDDVAGGPVSSFDVVHGVRSQVDVDVGCLQVFTAASRDILDEGLEDSLRAPAVGAETIDPGGGSTKGVGKSLRLVDTGVD
jgi:hypothetical protein